MSTHALSWAWRQEVGDAGAKLVLLKLADQANDRGECWPSHRTLARECEMSRRTVQRKLEILYDLGVVRAVQRSRETGGDSSLLYRVGIHAVTERVSAEHASAAVRQSDAPPCATDDAPPAPLVTHHEPSDEPTPPDGGESAARAARSRDLIWEILEEKFGRVAPRTNAHGKRAKAAADLRRLDATGESVRYAISRWPFVLPAGTFLTDVGLATHYPQLVVGHTATEATVGAERDPVDGRRRHLREAEGTVRHAMRRVVCAHCEIGGGRHSVDCPAPRETVTQAYRRFVVEAAGDPALPMEELREVVSMWRDLDDIERAELLELAAQLRAATVADEEAA